MNKIFTCIAIASTILLLGACNDESTDSNKASYENQENDERTTAASEEKPKEKPIEAVDNETLSKKYLQNEAVIGARIDERNGMLQGKIMFNDSIDKKEAIEVGKQFSEELEKLNKEKQYKVDIVQSAQLLETIKN
ncbi:hypothetical protein [Oceanihabitans sediminis]|uniref:hypothetical protein n=1 Tax=Oceanihabitans sediminis TaxID=1812012 RepID=UPI00299E613A|nr:hypothetical protein [Oceanihabitans sediminis]MDX1774900.1 hypothetical protein [Oceanihabitans sediminis]